MSDDIHRQWAERVIRTISHVFPDGHNTTLWPLCQRCLPHVPLCATLAKKWDVALLEAGHLLSKAGIYLYKNEQYIQAENLFQQALHLYEQALEPEHVTMMWL